MSNGYITVKVGRLPGQIQEYVLNGDRTVRAALAVAGLNANGYEVRLNGNPVTDLGTAVSNGDQVLLTRVIKGNRFVSFLRKIFGKN